MTQPAAFRRGDDPPVIVPGVDPEQLPMVFNAPAPPVTSPRSPRSPAFRSYDYPCLSFVARCHAATLHQLVDRFATYDGKRPAHIVRVVRALVARGWLRASRLDPTLGRASRQVLTLTAAGWAELGDERPPDPLHELPYRLDHRLQEAEFALEHEARGWRLVPQPAEAWRALKASALAHYRRPGRSELDTAHDIRIGKLLYRPLPVPLWLHCATGAVLLVFPSRRGVNLPALLAQLPDLHLWPTLRIHLVGADHDRVERDKEVLRRWAARTKHRVSVGALAPFRQHVRPWSTGQKTPSLYAQHGVPSPRATIILERRSGHATGSTYAVISRAVPAVPTPAPLRERPLGAPTAANTPARQPSQLLPRMPVGPSQLLSMTASRISSPPREELDRMREARRRIRPYDP